MVLNGSRTCLAETCVVAAIGLLTLYLVMKYKESSKVRVKVSPGVITPITPPLFLRQTNTNLLSFLSHVHFHEGFVCLD